MLKAGKGNETQILRLTVFIIEAEIYRGSRKCYPKIF